MKSWVKLYTEINEDPKMRPFTWAQRGIWSALLALAGKLDKRNGDGAETGQLETVEDTAWCIRCEIGEFTEAIEPFFKPMGPDKTPMLHEQDGVLYITNYGKRQARPASARPEATKERKREQRASESRGCHEDVTRMSQAVTPPEADTEADTDTDTEADTQDPAAALFIEAVSIWEDMTGRITERTRQQFDMAAEEYGEERLLYAVKEAHDHNAKSWAYVEAVLEGRAKSRDGPQLSPADLVAMTKEYAHD